MLDIQKQGVAKDVPDLDQVGGKRINKVKKQK